MSTTETWNLWRQEPEKITWIRAKLSAVRFEFISQRVIIYQFRLYFQAT